MSRLIDLAGIRFGKLIVVQYIRKNKFGVLYWLCKCDCGNSKTTRGSNLRDGLTKSCGCIQKKMASDLCRKLRLKHGHSMVVKRTRTYESWISMISRCNNNNHKYYHCYGGRGIKVCERWNRFENFLEDMKESPPRFQIDRIDNNGDYCKENCRWVTSKVNNRNRRNNRLIIFNGKTQCLSAWAEEYNISDATLRARISKFNWTIKDALTIPVGARREIGDQNRKHE